MIKQPHAINLNAHISTLSDKVQYKIINDLMLQRFSEEDIQLVLSGRLRDIEDNVDLNEIGVFA